MAQIIIKERENFSVISTGDYKSKKEFAAALEGAAEFREFRLLDGEKTCWRPAKAAVRSGGMWRKETDF